MSLSGYCAYCRLYTQDAPGMHATGRGVQPLCPTCFSEQVENVPHRWGLFGIKDDTNDTPVGEAIYDPGMASLDEREGRPGALSTFELMNIIPFCDHGMLYACPLCDQERGCN